MNKKNLVRFFGVTLVILFLCIYIGQASGYYEYSNFKRTSLTNDAITKFEDDVKKGKNIKATNYLKNDKQYDNALNSIALKTSNLIEKTFDNIMSSLFNGINKAISKQFTYNVSKSDKNLYSKNLKCYTDIVRVQEGTVFKYILIERQKI